jgi:dTDP-4-dehydrorhamnose 3,5-epimerase
MEFVRQKISDVILITPKVFEDARGFFLESYKKNVFQANGITVDFVQDNHSFSKKGVLRGLHFQKPPMAQDKLVRVVTGEVFDVVVDLRKHSPTFGQWLGIILSETNKQMLFIPKGFAHGFLALSATADFEYKVSNLYSPENDSGLLWNDPEVGIDWPIKDPFLNDKDKKQPRFKELGEIFV